jgi:disulfide bond formation protein DsbB
MYGLWLLILFIFIPAGVGAALAYVISRDERPQRKVLLAGALVGAVVGLTAGILLARL